MMRSALLHHDPAAERHRQPAHGARLQQHDHGRADPLPPHARRPTLWQPGTDHAGIATQMVVERQLEAEARPATTSAAMPSSSGSGSGRASPAAPSPASCAASARRSTGSTNASRWTRACPTRSRGLRPAVRGGPDLPRQAAGQLGPGAAHRRLRPRGDVRRRVRPHVAHALPAEQRHRDILSSRPPARRPCSATAPWR
jgi:hypothetical protein